MLIYKIFSKNEWDYFLKNGVSPGSAKDVEDGYIHLSTYKQVEGTIKKHFPNAGRVVLASFSEGTLESLLKWERSRKGDLFPHLYRSIHFSEVVSHKRFLIGANLHAVLESL